MMFNALIALGVPSKMQDVVLGVMLIIVMGIALNNKRISGFFERKARRKELMRLFQKLAQIEKSIKRHSLQALAE